MHDLLSKLDHEDILALCGMMVGVIAIIGGISVVITKVVSAHYRKSQLDEMEATLKLEMVQRGMSAGEIKQVLEANMRGRSSWADAFQALTTDQNIHS
jgi:uncharacterized membrane protein YcjF (UPF0283 family)